MCLVVHKELVIYVLHIISYNGWRETIEFTSMIDTFLILARGLEEASVMFRLEIME